MKKLFPILTFCLFCLNCEQGWIKDILIPVVEGCIDSDACNYNSDAEDDDGSCLTNDCAGECGGLAVVDSCLVCDIDISNDCIKDCAGTWGGTVVDCDSSNTTEPISTVEYFNFYPNNPSLGYVCGQELEISAIARDNAGVGVCNIPVRFQLIGDEDSTPYGSINAEFEYTCVSNSSENAYGLASIKYSNFEVGIDILIAKIIDPSNDTLYLFADTVRIGNGSNCQVDADCSDYVTCSNCTGCESSCCPNYCSGNYYYYNRSCSNGFCVGATSNYCSDGCNDDGCVDAEEEIEDTQFPTATILSPASGATVSEITTIEVYATDNVGIQKIEFYIADSLVVTKFDSPYEYGWNTSSYSDGVDYTIMVKVFDTSENMTIVPPILLTVDNTGKYPTTPTIYGRYEDSKFLLSWTQNDDSDFASYTLYESTNSDMADSTGIYTSINASDNSYEVTGIGADTRRYYRLIITDSIGLKSASNLQGVSNYQKIVFRLGNDINIIDIDGESRTNITSEIDGYAMFPQFTHDGKKIIYSYREQSGANGDYYIMNLDGTEKTNITNGSVPNDIDMSGYKISPNGTKILFYDWGDCYDIWVINIDGTGLTNLTNNRTTCDRYPDFSSDGQKIIFISGNSMRTMDSNGGGVTVIFHDSNHMYSVIGEYPIYAPIGDKIAYKSYNHLHIINSEGGNNVQLTTSVTVPNSEMAEAVFSPNGQSLVYRTGGSTYGIGFINIDGTGETNLTPNSLCHEPSVSPDGSKIVFIEQGSGINYMKIMDIDGSNVQTLYSGDTSMSRPKIQPIP